MAAPRRGSRKGNHDSALVLISVDPDLVGGVQLFPCAFPARSLFLWTLCRVQVKVM